MAYLRKTSTLFVAATIAALLFVGLRGEAQACFMASHTRRILLGSANGGLVVLEFVGKREDGGFGGWSGWKGPARVGLLVFPEGRLRESRPLRPVKSRGFALGGTLRRLFRAGMVAARSYPGFRPAGMPRHYPCDFASACEGVQFHIDEARRTYLQVSRAGAEMRAPVPLPEDVYDDVNEPPVKPGQLTTVLFISILSYDIRGHEVLVADFGIGDVDNSSGEEAIWPPCDCDEVSRCLPIAETMHHGTQMELVVPLDTAQPPPDSSPAPEPAARPLCAEDLSQAERGPDLLPRTDGIYVTNSVCRRGKGWSRRFLRFLPDGIVRQDEGNETLREAFRLTADDAHVVIPAGKPKVTGRRLSVVIFDNPDDTLEPVNPSAIKWTLDGIVEERGIRAMSGSKTARAVPAFFRFVPMTESAGEPSQPPPSSGRNE